ncbi:MAG: substrate-binding domain-containing protein [Prevotella sp.]|nr:substrate-binding domain-containing protein [Prevotella sp.]MBQ4294281.1 substrate-binding domain-containing protein [Prevotella sp.]MBR7055074.1 substrate-binding domain-containing protein [Prevotella sp.]
MKKAFILTFIGMLLTGIAIISCDNSDKRGGRTDTETSGEVTIAADESLKPIIQELIDDFQFKYPKAKINLLDTTENRGFELIRDMQTCLFFTTRPLKDSEVAYLKTKNQLPEVFPIGYDALSLIVHPANNDTCITVNDIKRILNGEVTKWNEVFPSSKLGNFNVVFDNKESATLHYVVDSILDGKPINNPNVTAAKTSAEVIEYVHDTPGAIGVIGSNWLNDKNDSTNLTFINKVRVMGVSTRDKATPQNSWKPYAGYLLDGRYPFARTIYAICVDPPRKLPYSFANYITKPVGQKIVLRAGLLPYRGDIVINYVNVKK